MQKSNSRPFAGVHHKADPSTQRSTQVQDQNGSTPENRSPHLKHSSRPQQAHGTGRAPLSSTSGSRNDIAQHQGPDIEEQDTAGDREDDFSNWDEEDPLRDPDEMSSDLRPSMRRPTNGRSYDPPIDGKAQNGHTDGRSPMIKRRNTFRERDQDDHAAAKELRKRYSYAAFFLAVSLVSFTIQTETAVYIKKYLDWNKSYAMLYFTHGSWSMLWFLQLAILRLQNWSTPWDVFWRRHVQNIRQTALMVQYQDVNAPQKYGNRSPIPYMVKTVAFVTTALTVAGGSWYVAVSMTTASDLTAIYNCSAFFAYAFSVPLLGEKLRWNKMFAVAVAIAGVLIVAYGDTHPAKHGSHSGGGTGGKSGHPEEDEGPADADNRPLGNMVIGIGSVLYGFYEVLYKKWACPPEDTSPGRSMIFANLFGTLIGCFTLGVLWMPLPVLHWIGWEVFELPKGEAAWMLMISVFANASSFLVLISLTSPVLSSVAALLTIFLVALVDQLLPPPLHTKLSAAAMVGGLLIIFAFGVLSWSTWKEMEEERKKHAEVDIDSDLEEMEDT